MEQNLTIHKKHHLLGRRNMIGGFIAAHGAMHALLLNTPRPDGGVGNFMTRGGEVPPLGLLGLDASAIETLGAALMLITAAGLVVTSLMYIRQLRGWEDGLMAFSALSIVSLLLFWNDWMVMGPVISMGTMALAFRSKVTEVA